MLTEKVGTMSKCEMIMPDNRVFYGFCSDDNRDAIRMCATPYGCNFQMPMRALDLVEVSDSKVVLKVVDASYIHDFKMKQIEEGIRS